MIAAHHSRVQTLDLAHFCGETISLSLGPSNCFSSNEQLCIETLTFKEWRPCRMGGRSFKGLPRQLKEASKGEKEALPQNCGRGVRGTATRVVMGEKWAGRRPGVSLWGEQGWRKWVSNRLLGLPRKQKIKGRNWGEAEIKERDLRITPKVCLKEFGNQLAIWGWFKTILPFQPQGLEAVRPQVEDGPGVNQNPKLGCQQSRGLCGKFGGKGQGVVEHWVSVCQRLPWEGRVLCH